MADNTYGPLVYHTQGSTELVVASSGLLRVEDGGQVPIESGGYINVEAGGQLRHYVSGATSSASGSTTLSTLTNDGLSFITSSGDARMLYLSAPYAGAVKDIYFTAGSTGTVVYIDAQGVSTGVVYESTRRFVIWEGTTGGAAAGFLELVGHSTSKWIVKSMTTDMNFADTSS